MKRYLIPAVILAILLVLLLLWPRRGANVGIGDISEATPQPSVVTKPVTPADETNLGPKPGQTMNEFIEEGERKHAEARLRSMNAGRYTPVAFYGLVVDQDTNVLQNVTVDLEVVEEYVVFPFQPTGQVTHLEMRTGADGRFEVSGLHGNSLTIENLTKEGYEPERNKRNCGEYGVQSGSFGEPVVFRMWSTNLHQELIRGKKSFEVVPDGRPYLIDLTTGTLTETGPGDLKVWIKTEANMVRGQDYDWACEVDVINGGLLEQPRGVLMYRAPAEGYSPSFSFQSRLKGGQRGWLDEKCYYVKLKNGQEYGAISIQLCAPYNERIPGMIRLSYTINPSGSRFLW